MKILLFSDLHGNKKLFELLRDKAKSVDKVLCAGDITNMGNDLDYLLDRINSIGRSTLIIHGNHESEEEMKDLAEDYENLTFLHKGVHIFDDYLFMGYGGGGFSQVDTHFSVVANMFFKKQDLDSKKRLVLLTHAPPFKTSLDLVHGEHRGNKSIRNFIDEVQPHLVVSGHLHENSGKHQRLGRSLLINPGPEGIVVDI